MNVLIGSVEIGDNRLTGSYYLEISGHTVDFDRFSTEPGPFGPAMLVLYLENKPVALIGAAPDDPETQCCRYPDQWARRWCSYGLPVIGNSLSVWPVTYLLKESGMFTRQEIATALDNQGGAVYFDWDSQIFFGHMEVVKP